MCNYVHLHNDVEDKIDHHNDNQSLKEFELEVLLLTCTLSVSLRHAPDLNYPGSVIPGVRSFSRFGHSRVRSFPGLGHSRGSVLLGVRSFSGFGPSRGSVILWVRSFSGFGACPGFGHSWVSVIPGVRSFLGFGNSRGSVIPGVRSFPVCTRVRCMPSLPRF